MLPQKIDSRSKSSKVTLSQGMRSYTMQLPDPSMMPLPIIGPYGGSIVKKPRFYSYGLVRVCIMSECFGAAAKVLWKLHSNGKSKETQEKAQIEKDWFSLATLRYMDAASKEYDIDAYDRAFSLVPRMGTEQANAFFSEIVRRRHDFPKWNDEVESLDQPIRAEMARTYEPRIKTRPNAFWYRPGIHDRNPFSSSSH